MRLTAFLLICNFYNEGVPLLIKLLSLGLGMTLSFKYEAMGCEQKTRLLKQTGEPASLKCIFGGQSIGNPTIRAKHPLFTHISQDSGLFSEKTSIFAGKPGRTRDRSKPSAMKLSLSCGLI